jgi:hypothetical protein
MAVYGDPGDTGLGGYSVRRRGGTGAHHRGAGNYRGANHYCRANHDRGAHYDGCANHHGGAGTNHHRSTHDGYP